MPTRMQADSEPGERNYVDFQTGEEWFASLPPERQAQQASFLKSPAKLKAYRDGVALSEFVGTHDDSIFGEQVIEQSLIKTIANASEYYTRGGE